MPYRQDRALKAMHVAEYILRSPHRMAHFLEAAGKTVLEDAAKLLARRLGLRNPSGEGKSGEPATRRVAYRYRLEVVDGEGFSDDVRPLKTGDEQARWLSRVIPRSPIEIGGGLYLDWHYRPVGFTQYEGSFDHLRLEARHIFAPALLVNAAGVSIWHTHPEQDPRPSQGDREWTRDIRHCGRSLRIPVLTSIVLGADGQHAFVD